MLLILAVKGAKVCGVNVQNPPVWKPHIVITFKPIMQVSAFSSKCVTVVVFQRYQTKKLWKATMVDLYSLENSPNQLNQRKARLERYGTLYHS